MNLLFLQNKYVPDSATHTNVSRRNVILNWCHDITGPVTSSQGQPMNIQLRPGIRTALLVSSLAFAALSVLAAALGVFTGQSDVGITPEKGNATFSSASGVYTVTGGGANTWGKVDAFHFVYNQISGGFSLSADVNLIGKGNEDHRKAGLMIRQSLAPDAPYVDVLVHGDGLTALQYRDAPAADTQEMRSDVKAPQSLRIERRGDQFSIAAGATGDLKTTGPVSVSSRTRFMLDSSSARTMRAYWSPLTSRT